MFDRPGTRIPALACPKIIRAHYRKIVVLRTLLRGSIYATWILVFQVLLIYFYKHIGSHSFRHIIGSHSYSQHCFYSSETVLRANSTVPSCVFSTNTYLHHNSQIITSEWNSVGRHTLITIRCETQRPKTLSLLISTIATQTLSEVNRDL